VKLGLALLLALAGCGLEEIHSCTDIGCDSGFGVMLTNPPAEPYRVDATGGSDTRSQNCLSGGACRIFFRDFVPPRATIQVIAASGTASYDVTPQQSVSRPNGPDCEPVCTRASVVVSGVIGAVSVYKSAGRVQCFGGGLTPPQMQIELTAAGIGVIAACSGLDGNVYATVCGISDGRINIFEIQSSDVAAAQALGFVLLSSLPNATRVAC
jgi:hypothetical protein